MTIAPPPSDVLLGLLSDPEAAKKRIEELREIESAA